MSTDAILSVLLAAAAFLKRPAGSVAKQALRDAYDAVKTALRRKFGEGSDADRALELATAKPESLMRKAVLAEATADYGLDRDGELIRLVEQLAALLPPPRDEVWQDVHVAGSHNVVHVAGRDLIRTEKIVRRNSITPDERHLTVAQRDQLRDLAADVGRRLTGGAPGGIAAAHAMLQRRFQVPSYLLIPGEKFGEVVAFLRQQKAARRSRLRDRDPARYASELYRAIFAGARELGWEGGRVYGFAAEKVGVTPPIESLKELGLVQLKTLATAIQGEVRRARRHRNVADATEPISG